MATTLAEAAGEALQRLGMASDSTPKPQPSAESTTSDDSDKAARRAEREAAEKTEAQNRENAKRYHTWQMLSRRIGSRYADCRLNAWKFHGDSAQQDRQRSVTDSIREYGKGILDRVKEGSGVFLFGPPGTGKDYLVAALMRCAVLAHGLEVEWANGVDLFGAIRDAIGGESSERQVVSQWVSPAILSLSDPLPPRGGLTDFQASMLFRIVDSRYRAMRPTWVTLNVENRAEAESRMGTQVVSRLIDSGLVCRCEWSDFRTAAK